MKKIEINLQKLVEKIEIHTQSLDNQKLDTTDMVMQVEKALLRTLNSISTASYVIFGEKDKVSSEIKQTISSLNELIKKAESLGLKVTVTETGNIGASMIQRIPVSVKIEQITEY